MTGTEAKREGQIDALTPDQGQQIGECSKHGDFAIFPDVMPQVTAQLAAVQAGVNSRLMLMPGTRRLIGAEANMPLSGFTLFAIPMASASRRLSRRRAGGIRLQAAEL